MKNDLHGGVRGAVIGGANLPKILPSTQKKIECSEIPSHAIFSIVEQELEESNNGFTVLIKMQYILHSGAIWTNAGWILDEIRYPEANIQCTSEVRLVDFD